MAPGALAAGGWFYHYGWEVVVASAAVMSCTGFFVLPAMQVTSPCCGCGGLLYLLLCSHCVSMVIFVR
jgi:hypothetical protein